MRILLVLILLVAVIAVGDANGVRVEKSSAILAGACAAFAMLIGSGWAVAAAVAALLRKQRRTAVFRHFSRFGELQFLRDQVRWYENPEAIRDFLVDPRVALISLGVGTAAMAIVLILLLLRLFSAWPEDLLGSNQLLTVLAMAGSAGLAFLFVRQSMRRSIEAGQTDDYNEIIRRCREWWEAICAELPPRFLELEAASQEIVDLGRKCGWTIMREAFKRSADGTYTPPSFLSADGKGLHDFEARYDNRLCLDLSAIISRRFRESSGKRQSDAECLRRAFTVTRRGLKRGKAALMNVSTVYWEAVAAGCETEVKLRTTGLWAVEDGLRRWAILMDQLFSISVVTLLEGVVRGEDPAEFIRTVTAIAEALGELAAEADSPRKNTFWAYCLLGMKPDAPSGEVKQVYQNLLALWEPAAAADISAGGRLAAVKEAYALLKERGGAGRPV